MLRFLKSFEPRVLMLAVAILTALWAFLSLADEVAEGETMSLDRAILLWFRNPGDHADPLGPRGFEEAVRDVTALGGFTVLTLVTVVATVAFLFHGRWRHAAAMAGAVLFAQLCSSQLKDLYSRPRPDLVPHGSYVYSGSFPSGHSMMSAATFLTLAMLISTLETRRATKGLAYGVAALLVATIGVSRVYLGVHWPSDVLGGWCMGSAVALAAWTVLIALGGRPVRPVD